MALADSRIRDFLKMPSPPHVIAPQWVVDSVKANEMLEVGPYLTIEQLKPSCQISFGRRRVSDGRGDGGSLGGNGVGGDGDGGSKSDGGGSGATLQPQQPPREEEVRVHDVGAASNWACLVCTFSNDVGNHTCRICATQRHPPCSSSSSSSSSSSERGGTSNDDAAADDDTSWATAVATSSSPRVFCGHCLCIAAPVFVVESFADARAALVQWVERVDVPTAWHTRLVCAFVRDMIHARRPVDVVNLLRFLSRRGEVWERCAKSVAGDTEACCIAVFDATLMWRTH